MTPLSISISPSELLDTIRRMAFMAEHYDKELIQHRERVRGYCRVLARGLGLSTDEADMIAFASLLHDVGKVALPVEIAAKAGNLTPYEWDVTKRHTITGADILRGSSFPLLQVAEVIALTHHERWDGSGYPRGLKKEEIPMTGRICAVADVFDALTTRRSYKPAVPLDDAIQLIKDSSGQLFDPRVVDIFSEHTDEIVRVKSTGTNRLVLER